jgi:molybdopterin converting factor small subunit
MAGADRVELVLPDAPLVSDLKSALAEQYPQMQPLLGSLLVAVGAEYASDDTPVSPTADVACFPPVSGG